MQAELWASLVAFFLPLGIAAILRQQWSDEQKALAGFGICMVAALGTAYFTGQISFEHLNVDKVITIALIVFNGAIVAFKGIWKPLGVTKAIERRTG